MTDHADLRRSLASVALDIARELVKAEPDPGTLAELDARAELLREKIRDQGPVRPESPEGPDSWTERVHARAFVRPADAPEPAAVPGRAHLRRRTARPPNARTPR